MSTTVVHCKKSDYDVYIGRPGPFGNPFKMGRDGDRDQVVAQFREWVPTQPEVLRLAARVMPGKRLGCYCAPEACHGDVYAELCGLSYPEPVFVFGSNYAGRHGKGAAQFAMRWHGAVRGQGEGLQGDSYALPTKDANIQTLPLESIRDHVAHFLAFAKISDRHFEVSRLGCGLAGYRDEEIAPMFEGAPANVELPGLWQSLLGTLSRPRVIVAGSRGYEDLNQLTEALDRTLKGTAVDIVSGAAKGADTLGEEYAVSRRLGLRRMPADWDRFSKAAGYIRNQRMSWYSTHLVAFWDGRSPGTKAMLTLAKADGLKAKAVRY